MQTKDEYMGDYKKDLGEKEFSHMSSVIDNEYYALVESQVKQGKPISKKVYDSLSNGQQFHFNKHYNHRGDMVRD